MDKTNVFCVLSDTTSLDHHRDPLPEPGIGANVQAVSTFSIIWITGYNIFIVINIRFKTLEFPQTPGSQGNDAIISGSYLLVKISCAIIYCIVVFLKKSTMLALGQHFNFINFVVIVLLTK